LKGGKRIIKIITDMEDRDGREEENNKVDEDL